VYPQVLEEFVAGVLPQESGKTTQLRASVAICICRFGFVTFEKKDDAQRAVTMCKQNLFLIGASASPVTVEFARTEVGKSHALHCLCAHSPDRLLLKHVALIEACGKQCLEHIAVLFSQAGCAGR
jgi:hypothetical protein